MILPPTAAQTIFRTVKACISSDDTIEGGRGPWKSVEVSEISDGACSDCRQAPARAQRGAWLRWTEQRAGQR